MCCYRHYILNIRHARLFAKSFATTTRYDRQDDGQNANKSDDDVEPHLV